MAPLIGDIPKEGGSRGQKVGVTARCQGDSCRFARQPPKRPPRGEGVSSSVLGRALGASGQVHAHIHKGGPGEDGGPRALPKDKGQPIPKASGLASRSTDPAREPKHLLAKFCRARRNRGMLVSQRVSELFFPQQCVLVGERANTFPHRSRGSKVFGAPEWEDSFPPATDQRPAKLLSSAVASADQGGAEGQVHKGTAVTPGRGQAGTKGGPGVCQDRTNWAAVDGIPSRRCVFTYRGRGPSPPNSGATETEDK